MMVYVDKMGSIGPATRYVCRYQCPKRENKIGHFEKSLYTKAREPTDFGQFQEPHILREE